jgi:hypothetical protein
MNMWKSAKDGDKLSARLGSRFSPKRNTSEAIEHSDPELVL